MMSYMDLIRPISAILFCFVSRNICGLNMPWIKFVLWVIVTYVIVAVTVYFNVILGSVVVLIMVFMMQHSSGKKIVPAILCSLISMIILVICNSINSTILNRLYEDADFYANVGNNARLYLSLIGANYLLSHILTKLAGRYMSKRFVMKEVNVLSKNIIFLFLVTTVIIFLFVYFTAINKDTINRTDIFFIYIASLIFLGIITYFVYNASVKDSNLSRNVEELNQLEEYTNNIEIMYSDIRSLRHDYSNVIASLAGYVKEKDMDGLKIYFENEIIPFSDRMELADNNLGVLSKLKDPSLKGIVAIKLIRAQENNIKVLADIKEKISISGIELLDINRIIGILLDNAYEAASECNNPFIDIAFVKDEDMITIVVLNSIKNKDISISKIFNQGFSTKGKNRGYGLSNVAEILKKYPDVYMDTEICSDMFKQVLYIKKVSEET